MRYSGSAISLKHRRWIQRAILVVGAMAGVCGTAIAMQETGSTSVLVTQKNREFQPGIVALSLGEVLHILNDDGQLMHHAYVASKKFDFDSGEQLPGTTVDILFPALGKYVVLCGIHPKMRLDVTVQ